MPNLIMGAVFGPELGAGRVEGPAFQLLFKRPTRSQVTRILQGSFSQDGDGTKVGLLGRFRDSL